MTDPVILSYGLGVDSTAILLRWLTEPATRDFDLADLTVVTAMTGDEWAQTGVDVETHILPLLREHKVRFVQVARAQRHVTVNGGGVVTLDDSRHPTKLHLAGSYRLSDEMLSAGTIPQSGGARLCSVHAKGDALDPTIAAITEGKPYRHVVGFEANEPRRATKDTGYNTGLRTGIYPLIEWGWDRATCEAYIKGLTGVDWDKSACTFCPFALGNKAGRERVLARYAAEPQAGVDALWMEHVALALNPAQGLIGGKRLADVVAEAAPHVTQAFRDRLQAAPHVVYEVRRVLRPTKADPTKLANASRSVRRHTAVAGRAATLAVLRILADEHGQPVEHGDDGIGRVYLRRRGATLPTTEHFLVAAPAVVDDKEADKFDAWWDAALAGDVAATATEPDRPTVGLTLGPTRSAA